MDYNQLIDGLKSAGHEVSGYAPPEEMGAHPVPKKSPTAASLTLIQLAGAIDEAIARYTEPLEQRIKELEARPTLRYMGVFEEGIQYSPGEFVTCSGQVWHCHAPTRNSPPGNGWQLAVKRGRDAREAFPRTPKGLA
jgi:hypothetical protein